MNNRREFITLLGGAAAAWPLAARAQQPAMPVIGFLASYSASGDAATQNAAAFRQGLNEIGYVEGRNVMIAYRYGEGNYDRLPELAAELVQRQVNVLVAAGGSGLEAKAATTTIPIVAMIGGDPVSSGHVASLNRPGGNLTGVALFAYSLGPKRLEVLRELIPNAKLIAVLANPAHVAALADTHDVEAAARAAGQPITILTASSESEFEQLSPPWCSSGRTRSWSWPIPTSTTGASNWSRWWHATPFPQSTNGASSPRPAA